MRIATAILIQNGQVWRLRNCLKGNLTQTRQPDEVIVTDIGSSKINKNHYKALIDRLEREFETKIKFIESEQPQEIFKPSLACNLSWINADADVVVFTGIDEVPGPLNYELTEKIFENNVQAYITSGRLDLNYHSNDPGINFAEDFDRIWIPRPLHYKCPGSFLGLPRDWLQEIGGFDEFYEGWGVYDKDIVAQADKSGLKRFKLHEYGGRLLHVWHDYRDYVNKTDMKRNQQHFKEKFK